MEFIDTHAHLDGEEFSTDLPQVIQRAQDAGVKKVFIPAINADNVDAVLRVSQQYPGYAFPMVGLQPEEVKADWQEQLKRMKGLLDESMQLPVEERDKGRRFIAVGEVGLDFYWSREFEQEQLEAFEEQVKWAIEYQLPLMIHCRKENSPSLCRPTHGWRVPLLHGQPAGGARISAHGAVCVGRGRRLHLQEQPLARRPAGIGAPRPHRPGDRQSLHGARAPSW